MKPNKYLNVTDIRDEDGKIRPVFPVQANSGIRPNGSFAAQRDNGKILMEITYSNGIVDGPYVDYWSNGEVATRGQFLGGSQHGTWSFYHEDGSLMETIRFVQGKEVR